MAPQSRFFFGVVVLLGNRTLMDSRAFDNINKHIVALI